MTLKCSDERAIHLAPVPAVLASPTACKVVREAQQIKEPVRQAAVTAAMPAHRLSGPRPTAATLTRVPSQAPVGRLADRAKPEAMEEAPLRVPPRFQPAPPPLELLPLQPAAPEAPATTERPAATGRVQPSPATIREPGRLS